jgi:phosphopentomutase
VTAVNKRAVVLVLDGFGVGVMADAVAERPRDAGAHTLASLVRSQGDLAIPNLIKLGLGTIAPEAGLPPAAAPPAAAWGRCNLAHWGADTYAGHNEIQGNRPRRPVIGSFSEVAEAVRQKLEGAGHRVEQAIPGGSAWLVDGQILVGDNLETDPGRVYNVTGPLDAVPMDQIVAVGRLVREVVKVSRVIALGGVAITVRDILAHTRTTDQGQTGVDTPALHIYNEHYQVRHLGYGVDPDTQAPSLVAAAGLPVALVGKMADVVVCEQARWRDPVVDTGQVMAQVLEQFQSMEGGGYVTATVQETDLAGHEQDPARYAEVLARADVGIGQLLAKLREGDLLIILADHGNDPLIGHAFHTREQVPLLAAGPGLNPAALGVRATMADVAATVCDHLGAQPPEFGTSFLPALQSPAGR